MKVAVLSADKPIAKAYKLENGNLIKTPYPFVYEFTSTEHNVRGISGLYDIIKAASAADHCLLKGQLLRPLSKVSRAGSTDPNTPTQWICLDVDGLKYEHGVQGLLDELGLGHVSYVLQWSPSMGLDKSNNDLRCHIFMMLEHEVSPALLKSWLIHKNLTLPVLSSQLTLTKSGNSLRWPLDVTTCQNDKLIYVARPRLGPGITDPYPDARRISLVDRAVPAYERRFDNVPSQSDLRTLVDQRVNSLRAEARLPGRKAAKFKYDGTVEYMTNPAAARVTGIKEERGFVYFNLNGGDSWGYYHPIDNPKYIYNFKGEPVYLTEELLPAYWFEQKAKQSSGAVVNGRVYLAFREFETGAYFNGIYDEAQDDLKLAEAKSEKQVRDFLRLHGRPADGFVLPDWSRVFNPHSVVRVDPDARTVNLYQPSRFHRLHPKKVDVLPPICQKVLFSALGSDQKVLEHFLNWLACVFQYKEATQTAWVLHGTQGTGKGVLFHQIISPLLGREYCTAKRFDELESEFTSFVEGTLITMIDEVESNVFKHSVYHSKIIGKLKNLIVEPYVNARRMYKETKSVRNYNNLIFTSNKASPVHIDPDDRRFNVGVYQKNRLFLSPQEFEGIKAELEDVYHYLMSRPADRMMARTPLNNSARDTLIAINRTTIDEVSDALLNGNLEFFWDQLPSDKATATTSGPGLETLRLDKFRNLVVEHVQTPGKVLSRDDLFALYDYCVGNMPTSPNKFTSLLKHHRIITAQVSYKGRNVRGMHVNWKPDPTWLAKAQSDIAAGLV